MKETKKFPNYLTNFNMKSHYIRKKYLINNISNQSLNQKFNKNPNFHSNLKPATNHDKKWNSIKPKSNTKFQNLKTRPKKYHSKNPEPKIQTTNLFNTA